MIETPDGTVVQDGCKYLGELTNNQAEYDALVLALEAIEPEQDGTDLEIYSDSELLVKQLNGEYRVKNSDLRQRFVRVHRLLRHFDTVTVDHVRRGENGAADALANQAIDAYQIEREEAAEER